jgi:hypothetical protein
MSASSRTAAVKYGAVGALFGLYVAGSSWLVGRAGESYREALRRERLASAATPSPGTPLANLIEVAPAPPVRAEAAPVPAPAKRADERPPIVVAEARPAPPVPSLSPAATQPPATVAPAAPARKVDPLWDSPTLKKAWDVDRLGPDDEDELGRELHELITTLHKPLPQGPLTERVYNAAGPLTGDLPRKGLASRYRFTILDTDDVNAFSHPGRYVYVTRGLLEMIGGDEEYALQFALGHEIAHVEFQHMLRCLKDPGVKKIDAGTLSKAYLVILPWGYWPEDLDLEADRWAFEQLRKFGRTRRESLAYLRKLQDHAKKHGFGFERQKPRAGDDSSILENHIKAHPPFRDRLATLEALWPAPQPAPR